MRDERQTGSERSGRLEEDPDGADVEQPFLQHLGDFRALDLRRPEVVGDHQHCAAKLDPLERCGQQQQERERDEGAAGKASLYTGVSTEESSIVSS